jgi:hypothetical protein
MPAGGKKGYCASAAGLTYGDDVKLKDLICKACPAQVDERLKQIQPDVYSSCK